VQVDLPERNRRLRRKLRGGRLSQPGVLLLVSLFVLGLPLPSRVARAVTLAELRAEPHLTPEGLIKHFANFKFELGRETRSPDAFLARQAGDCDDFATLAAALLREKGYSTRLVAVFMPNEVHVVCYVAETKSYLDYNRRKEASPLMKCDADLGVIAASVAKSFRCQWRSVSEFTLRNGMRHFVSTVFR